jgi:hypothetical protein
MKISILALISALAIAGGAVAGQAPRKMMETSMVTGQAKMMAEMREGDKRLDELVKQLNATHGDERVDRLVAVVNLLVAERRQMREMMAMHGDMMMRHTAADTPAPEDDHSAHHPKKQ